MWWRWACMPICVIIIISSVIYPWPLMVRFRLSQNAFDEAVKQYQAGKFSGRSWVGLYYVKSAYDINYTNDRAPTIGFVTGASWLDSVGFEYDPLPDHRETYFTVKVGPSWYTYED